MWNKDEIKGKGKQISGAIKDKAGELIKDPKLEAKGEAERIAGKLQEKSGKARRKTGEAVQKVGKAIAERAKKAGVSNVVFDRGGFLFHGRVKALADAAREGGLEF